MIITDITSPAMNSYAGEGDLKAFADLRDITLPEKIAPLLIRAMDYLEGLDWAGWRSEPKQPLAWPRASNWTDTNCLPERYRVRLLLRNACWRSRRWMAICWAVCEKQL